MDEQLVSGCVDAVLALRTAARQARSWSTERRHRLLGALERLDALLVGVRSELLAAEQEAETWQTAGVRSLGARLGRDTGVGQATGNARVRQADAWADVAVLARAAEAGTITTGHVEAVGRVIRGAEPKVRAALTSLEGQDRLVALATRMDAPSFAKELARTAARMDPAGPERDLERQREARHLHVVDAPEGTRITGLVDHQCGRRVRLALEALSPRPAQDDPRTATQRRADALGDLADVVLSLRDTGSGAAVRPHVSVLMSVETLAELRAAQARRAAETETTVTARRDADAETSCTVRSLGFTAPVDPVTDEDGNVVPFSEVARMLCDCYVTRVVLDAEGEPIDVGRQERLYTGAQRRAVLARDRGCAWEGCGAPARWCEVHHIWWWDRDNGPTSVDNGAALCRFHHQVVHQRDLHLIRYTVDLPPGIGRPRGKPGGESDSGGFDPGMRTVRYVIRTRDGTVVAGERARSTRTRTTSAPRPAAPGPNPALPGPSPALPGPDPASSGSGQGPPGLAPLQEALPLGA